MTRGMVRFDVSAVFLRELMALPEGTQIYNIARHEFRPGVFVFYVEHPDFPVLCEGGVPLEVTPTVTGLLRGWDWGLDSES